MSTVVISKQGEESKNYKRFQEIVKCKGIKVIIVQKGDNLIIEKNLKIEILWPNNQEFISENILNNNSLICKLKFNSFSMLFTGDIEKLAEEHIVKEYKKNPQCLNATILKVGHHGSKTSSTEEFLNVVKPKMALIGVGEDNKFGHPNEDVIERLKNMKTKIYRTDKMGEICVYVNKNGEINVKETLKQNSF